MNVLAIGNSSAYEVDSYTLVAQHIRELGGDCYLFRQDECIQGDVLTFQASSNSTLATIIIDGKEYRIDDFSSIWYLKPQIPRDFLLSQPAEFRSFIETQFRQMRKTLWTIFRSKKWLNDPWNAHVAEDKFYQLYVAQRVGFQLPDTVITSSPSIVERFYSEHGGEIVTKLLSVSPIFDRVIYTNKVGPKEMEKVDTVRGAPAIFQSYVEKAYELRITVVGDKIFPVKINSQDDVGTSTDWRRKPLLNDFSVKMEIVVLPENVERNLMLFMRELGLNFGCVDMIVTPQGEHVFLEINPNGQWYFVQLETGADIARAIAEKLVL